MKHAILLLLAVGLAAGLAGCCWSHGPCGTSCLPASCANAPETCGSCGSGGCESCGGAGCQSCNSDANAGLGGLLGMGGPCDPGGRASRAREAYAPGPATGAITYPYYTVRGPRDFLARSPQSIGP